MPRRDLLVMSSCALLALAGCASSNATRTTGTQTSTTATVTSPAEPAPSPSAGTPGTPPASPPASTPSRTVTTRSGLQIEDLRVGDGGLAEHGMEVLVHYTGWFTDGTKFDSSIDRKKPLIFRLGDGTMISGMDEGVEGMRVGGKRKLIVPPNLGYGVEGRGAIPPNATLVFEVELLDLR